MTTTLSHRCTEDGVLILVYGAGVIPYPEARRFAWALLADVDPEEVGGPEADERVHKLRKALGLTPGCVKLLLALYDSPKALHTVYLTNVIGSRAEPDIVKVYVVHLRKALGRDVIDAVYKDRYVMTDAGRARLKEVLG